MKKLVIFDLDGTLINSIKDLGAATNYALGKHGYAQHPLEAYPMFVGNGVNKLIERALPEESRSEEIILNLRKDFTEYYDVHNTDYTVPYEGMVSLLEKLNGQGMMVAVASNKYEAATVKLVRHYFPNVKFVAICGQKEGVPVKPDPSVVFEILSVAGVRKQDTLYVGDSGVDMETARRACVDSVGVTWGFRSIAELQEANAGTIVSNADDIFDIAMQE